MIRTLLIFFGVTLGLYSNAQFDCDSIKCPHLAEVSSYEILEETVVREATLPAQPIMISCEMLCAIEEARSPIEDVIFYWGTLKILVYKRNEITK